MWYRENGLFNKWCSVNRITTWKKITLAPTSHHISNQLQTQMGMVKQTDKCLEKNMGDIFGVGKDLLNRPKKNIIMWISECLFIKDTTMKLKTQPT